MAVAGRAHAGAAAAGRQVDRQSMSDDGGSYDGSPVSSNRSSCSSSGSGSGSGSQQTNCAKAPEPHSMGGSGSSSGASSSGASGGSGGVLVGGYAGGLHAQLDALFAGGGMLGREGAMALLERQRQAAAGPARAARDSPGACPGSPRTTAGCGRGRRGGRRCSPCRVWAAPSWRATPRSTGPPRGATQPRGRPPGQRAGARRGVPGGRDGGGARRGRCAWGRGCVSEFARLSVMITQSFQIKRLHAL
jgi:hypothetical protein